MRWSYRVPPFVSFFCLYCYHKIGFVPLGSENFAFLGKKENRDFSRFFCRLVFSRFLGAAGWFGFSAVFRRHSDWCFCSTDQEAEIPERCLPFQAVDEFLRLLECLKPFLMRHDRAGNCRRPCIGYAVAGGRFDELRLDCCDLLHGVYLVSVL